MPDDEGAVERRAATSARRPGPDDDRLARALGALLGLPAPDAPATIPATPPTVAAQVPPVAASAAGSTASPEPDGPPPLPVAAAALVVPAPAPTTDDSFWNDSPVDAHAGEPGSVVASHAAALVEAGFSGPLHTALHELRRISDVTVPAEPAAGGAGEGGDAERDGAAGPGPDGIAAFSSVESDAPDWYTAPVPSVDSPPPLSEGVKAWLSGLGEWWDGRRRELLPVLGVAAVVVLAFTVVLVSAAQRSDTTRVGTTRVTDEPTTTVPSPYASAGFGADGNVPPPPGILGPGTDASLTSDGGSLGAAVTTTTKPKSNTAAGPPSSAGPASPQSASPTSPPATSPPATSPPATEPPATSPPQTSPPTTDPPVTQPPDPTPTTIDGCAFPPTNC